MLMCREVSLHASEAVAAALGVRVAFLEVMYKPPVSSPNQSPRIQQ